MPELAPGLLINDFVPRGKMYVMDVAEIGVPVPGPNRQIVMHPEDWERIPPGIRERLLDELTRVDADRGFELLQEWLAAAPSEGDSK